MDYAWFEPPISGNLVTPASASSSGAETAAQFVDIADVAPITAAQGLLLALGAKATVSVTLVAFGTFADGMTIVTPVVGSKTIKKTTAGDIDVSGAANIAAAAAIIGAYLAAALGSELDYVGTVGQVMTFEAKAYGSTLNGSTISGTLLTGTGTLTLGLEPIAANPAPALPTDVTIATTDVTTNDVSTSKHGWAPKLTAPASGSLNVLGIANGETAATCKTIIGTATPSTQAFGDSAAHGTSVEAAASDHKHAMPATPDLSALALKQSGTIDGLTSLGVRDTSAAHDVKVAAVSSVALTADRTLTIDVVNAAKTLKVTENAELGGVNTGDQTLAGLGGVAANGAIAAGTIPVSYDAKGLVTGGHASLVLGAANNLLLGGAASSPQASLAILATKTIAVPAAISVWRGLDVQGSTLTLTAGGVAPTSLSLAYLAVPTITQTAGAAYTLPLAATLAIAGPPVAGAGGGATPTITAPWALSVLAGGAQFVGSVVIGTASIVPSTVLEVVGAIAAVSSNATYPGSVKISDHAAASSAARGGLEFQYAYAGGGYGTKLFSNATLDTFGLATRFNSAVWTDRISVMVQTGYVGINVASPTSRLHIDASQSVVSAAGAVWDGIKFAASTLTLTGATTPVTALSFTTIAAPTITSASAITVTSAATLRITGSPIAAGSTTITRSWGIRVDAGVQITAGNLVLGASVTAGATADKCLALHNGATAPSASVDLCHLYCADNGAGHATLAIYQEEVVAAVGIKVTTEVLPVIINGVLKYIALAA